MPGEGSQEALLLPHFSFGVRARSSIICVHLAYLFLRDRKLERSLGRIFWLVGWLVGFGH